MRKKKKMTMMMMMTMEKIGTMACFEKKKISQLDLEEEKGRKEVREGVRDVFVEKVAINTSHHQSSKLIST